MNTVFISIRDPWKLGTCRGMPGVGWDSWVGWLVTVEAVGSACGTHYNTLVGFSESKSGLTGVNSRVNITY